MKLSDDFNGADLRNVCTEAGMYIPTPTLPPTPPCSEPALPTQADKCPVIRLRARPPRVVGVKLSDLVGCPLANYSPYFTKSPKNTNFKNLYAKRQGDSNKL